MKSTYLRFGRKRLNFKVRKRVHKTLKSCDLCSKTSKYCDRRIEYLLHSKSDAIDSWQSDFPLKNLYDTVPLTGYHLRVVKCLHISWGTKQTITSALFTIRY